MRMTTITILRPPTTGTNPDYTTIEQHLPVQVDQASEREAIVHAQLSGFRGVDLWHIYTMYLPLTPIQRGDHLLDETTNDPETGQPFTYKVVSRPKIYDDHQECLAETEVGG